MQDYLLQQMDTFAQSSARLPGIVRLQNTSLGRLSHRLIIGMVRKCYMIFLLHFHSLNFIPFLSLQPLYYVQYVLLLSSTIHPQSGKIICPSDTQYFSFSDLNEFGHTFIRNTIILWGQNTDTIENIIKKLMRKQFSLENLR